MHDFNPEEMCVSEEFLARNEARKVSGYLLECLKEAAEAGDDHTLRILHVARNWALRLARLLDPPKPFDQCTAADICESLAKVRALWERLPAGEPGAAREINIEALRALERATQWIEAAGNRSTVRLSGGRHRRGIRNEPRH